MRSMTHYKKIGIPFLMLILCGFILTACGTSKDVIEQFDAAEDSETKNNEETESEEVSEKNTESQEGTDEMGKLIIEVNGHRLMATLADNSSVDALRDLLADGPVTIDMHDFSNFEKVGDLPVELPTNDEQISTDYGDLILYLGKRFVIYYDKNSWDFTRLGHIDDITQDELKSILGEGDVTATLSLGE